MMQYSSVFWCLRVAYGQVVRIPRWWVFCRIGVVDFISEKPLGGGPLLVGVVLVTAELVVVLGWVVMAS